MITFVCGQLCSGKTLYSNTLSDMDKSIYVEVGKYSSFWDLDLELEYNLT